ncbi:MAG: hypothetical protein QW623_01155 [Candidatus Hadarchaeales archaeon]
MRVKVEENKIVVGFSSTQTKKLWKNRINGEKSADKILDHQIQKRDFFKIVAYQELKTFFVVSKVGKCLRTGGSENEYQM